ncbi:MAG: BACON domain-containing protein [Hyphomicrobiales bacterium]
MKRFFTLITLIILSFQLSAQAWLEELPEKNRTTKPLTFYEQQKAFYNYCKRLGVVDGYYTNTRGNKKKVPGWKQFKRYENLWESKVNLNTGEIPDIMNIYKEWKANSKRDGEDEEEETVKKWTSLGPTNTTAGYAGIGRINCINFHPNDENTLWVGTPGGGLWVTKDAATTWTPLTDNLPSVGISDIAIRSDYETSKTIYIATGDRDGNDTPSVGVYKSTDEGATWSETLLTFKTRDYTYIHRLLIDPTDDDILYAATSLGLYKTINGGETWEKTCSHFFNDLEFKTDDNNTLFGVTKSYTSTVNVYTSNDAGENWDKVHSVDGRRGTLSVTPDNSDLVLIAITNPQGGLKGIYKSSDAGLTYDELFNGDTDGNHLLNWTPDGTEENDGQGFYDLCLAINPLDENEVFIGGINTWKSVDGGTSWDISNHWTGAAGVPAIHADKHELVYKPGTSILYEANDGGIYKTSDNGESWDHLSNGLVISQLYRISTGPDNNKQVISGLQDNGTKLYNEDTWTDVLGGDGMECIIDYQDSDIQYGSIQQGKLHRTTNKWNSKIVITPADAGKGNWITPYVIHPKNPEILYAGYTELFKSTDRGDTWTKLSLSFKDENRISAIAICPTTPDSLFVSNDKELFFSPDGGTTWEKRTTGLPVHSAKITSISINGTDPSIAYTTFSGYNYYGVYRTENCGTNWSQWSRNLPQIPVNTVVHYKRNLGQEELFAGTDFGVFRKVNDDKWMPYNEGLPNISVRELEFFYDDNDGSDDKLIAATFGRGLWGIDFGDRKPMAFNNANARQKHKNETAPGRFNAEVISVNIATTGTLKPIKLNSIKFNLNGTTDLDDIDQLRLMYSGSSYNFKGNSEEITTTTLINNEIVFNEPVALKTGNNYFFLTCDTYLHAEVGNIIDAECVSVTVDGEEQTIVDSAPKGQLDIILKYCDAKADNPYYESIGRVQFNTIDNKGPEKGYSDFVSGDNSIYTNLVKGKTYPLTVEIENPYDKDHLVAWIDWDHNANFEDDEMVLESAPGDAIGRADIKVPNDAFEGDVRLRIRLNDTRSGYKVNKTSCGDNDFGEVEDYLIKINPAGYYLTVYPEQLDFENGGGNQFFDVTSNVVFTVESNKDWVTVDKKDCTGNSTITVTCNPNETFMDRNATIYLRGQYGNNKTVTISQQKMPASISINPVKAEVNNKENTLSFNITSNCEWTVEENYNWIEVDKENGSYNDVITLNVGACYESIKRVAEIKVKGEQANATFTLTQLPQDLYLKADQDNILFDQNGGEKTFSIQANQEWSIACESDWLTVSPALGENDQTISVNCQTTSFSGERKGQLIIQGEGEGVKVIEVTQQGPEPLITVNPNSTNVFHQADIFELSVYHTFIDSPTITDDCEWIKVTTENDKNILDIEFNYEENPSIEDSRAHTFTITAPYPYEDTKATFILIQERNVTDISEIDKGVISIFPNPAKDHLNISTTSIYDKIRILDVNSKVMHTIDTPKNNEVINIENWKSGLYFIEIKHKGKIFQQKIIKD